MSQNPNGRTIEHAPAQPIPPAAVFRNGWRIAPPESALALAESMAAGMMRRGHSRAASERFAGLRP